MRFYRYLVIYIVIFSILITYLLNEKNSKNYPENKIYTLEGIIRKEPSRVGYDNYTLVEDLYISFRKNLPLEIGDKVRVVGTLQRRVINPVNTQYWLINPEIKLVEKYQELPIQIRYKKYFIIEIKRLFLNLRHHLSSQYLKYFSKTYASLLSGMIFGIKEDIPTLVYDKLKDSGLVHLVVASGGNIAIFSSILLIVFKQIFTGRQSILLSFLFLIAYLFLAGFEPPIVRATMMIGSIWIAKLMGRKTSSLWVLFMVGSIMLLFDPLLLFSLSFQLSFLTTLGLIIFNDSFIDGLKHMLRLKKSDNSLVELLLVSLSQSFAAQVMVMPLFFVVIGEVNILSLFSMVLVAPILPLMIYGGLLVLAASYFSNSLTLYISFYVSKLLNIFVVVVELFSKFRFGTILLTIEWWEGILIWLGIFLILLAFKQKINSWRTINYEY
jgi:competence protein ComEC